MCHKAALELRVAHTEAASSTCWGLGLAVTFRRDMLQSPPCPCSW